MRRIELCNFNDKHLTNSKRSGFEPHTLAESEFPFVGSESFRMQTRVAEKSEADLRPCIDI